MPAGVGVVTAYIYAFAADVVLSLHAAFVLFVVAGQALILCGWWRAWRWTRGFTWRVAHLIAIGFVTLESWCGVVCPLTTFESALRLRAGTPGYHESFVGDWAQRLLFYSAPPWVFVMVYSAFTLLVLVTFIRYPPRRNRGCKRESNHAQ